ncbi:MAG TPA: phytanoyl-CoA dioxygenase family protein [Parvularculaceae bacterium]|nr:phytanoyl-CoA dioxygenase family protein [Parvularculaceae bacterium]
MKSLPAFSSSIDQRGASDLRAAFEETGVVILRNFATAEECAALKARAFALIDEFDIDAHRTVFSTTTQAHAEDDYFLNSGGDISFFLEEEAFGGEGKLKRAKRESINKIGHAMHDLDPVFSAFSRSKKMRAAARAAGFNDPLLLQSMVIMKPPGIGGEVTCHQDSTFLYTEPESCIGFWLAIDEASLDNGCMEFIPGEHRGPLRRVFRRKKNGGTEMIELSAEPFPEENRIAAPAGVGDLVIFSGRTPHMSRANRSARPRMAYTLHMIEAAAHYPEWNWLQRPAAMPLKGF